VHRRTFLRALAGTTAGAGTFVLDHPFRPRFRLANAQLATGKTLVVVFQRGGCDGLNTVVPYGDGEYYVLRPTIGIAPPSGGDPASAIDLDGFFGLHPGLADLKPVFDDGDMAVFPTAHYPEASRSHFTGQEWIESGAPVDDTDGWLNRHLVSAAASTGELRGVGIGSSLPHALRGDAVVSVFNNLADFTLDLPAAEEQFILDRLFPVYGQTPDPAKLNHELVHRFGRVVINDLSVVAGIDVDGYEPAPGASYPNTTFGRQMRQTAQLIKEGVGLEVATLGIGGWDNHSDQGGGDLGGRQARRFVDFAGGIAAMYHDLGSLMDDVVILTMTEFGRTAKENGSFGTDHGNAASWFAVSRSVKGGVYGVWPGLQEADLYRERYLAHTVDFRDIMGEVLSTHLGNTDLGFLLPGHTFVALDMFDTA
jgi:uncharacterized protein (DUF1501 family)